MAAKAMSAEFPTLAAVVAKHHWISKSTTNRYPRYTAGCTCGWERDIANTHRTGLQLQGEHVEQVWREACTIRKFADLDSLPEQSVVHNIAFGVVFESGAENDGAVIWRSPNGLEKSTVMLPALLLWHPDWAQS